LSFEKKDLVIYRYEKAQDTFETAELLLKENKLSHAVNRYYYAVFHCIQALLVTIDLSSQKHSGVIGFFNRHFVKTGLFDKKYAKIAVHIFEERSDADYEDFRTFSIQEVKDLGEDAADFLQAVGKYLSKEWCITS